MVVKCFNCQTLLKADVDRVPEGGQANVRCPKCGSKGIILAPQSPNDPKTDLFQQTETLENKTVETETDLMKDQHPSKTKVPAKASELTLPEDAFRDFRFPAEIEPSVKKGIIMSHKANLITFLIVSILVVALFAALVNIILPALPPGVGR